MSNSRLSRGIMSAVLVILIIMYAFYQLYTANGLAIKSDESTTYTAYKSIDTVGFAIRDESIIYSDKGLTQINETQDGTRVTYTTVVKRVFESDEDARLYQELLNTEEEINYYEAIRLQQKVMNIDRTTNDNNLSSAYYNILNAINENDYSSVISNAKNMKQYITNKQILTGEEIDVAEAMNILTEKKERLSATVKDTAITADAVGYYCGSVDGYESTISYESVDLLTMDDIKAALSSSPSNVPSNAIGKVNSGFVWYFACIVDTASISGFSGGDEVDVRVTSLAGETVKMLVHSITNADAENSVLILESQVMNADIANLRIENIQIITGRYDGIRIKSESLRSDGEGNTGVYVLVGNLIRFRTVECLYASDDYIVVKGTNSGKYSSLENYDKVIYEGKNLYDGRVL